MATIVERDRQDRKTSYYVVYRDGTGRKRWEQFEREKPAKARKAQVELELARSGGTWVPATRIAFEIAAEAWYERKKQALRESTRVQYRSALDAHLLPAFGLRPAVAIKPSDVQAFRAAMASKGKGQNTIKNVVGVLRMVMGELVYDGAIPSNPVDSLPRGRRPGRPPRRTTVPSPQEVSKLIAGARLHARPVLELAAATGLRRAELLRLRWRDIDVAAREIRVVESKTQAGCRVVPMFGSARRVLLEQKARSRFKRPDDLVFPTAVGTPEDPKGWHDREYLHARKTAGLRDTLRLHDLRHHAVSVLVSQGANIVLVSKVAGHATPDLTLRVYSHLFDRDLAEAAVKFDPLRDVVVDGR